MFEALTRIFSRPETDTPSSDPNLAVAALLVHLAGVDGEVSPAERRAVKAALADFAGLDEDQVDRLIAEATRRDAEAVDFYRFTSALKSLDEDQRVEVIRLMWQVVFADDRNHELEDNMVWRIAELIGVSARQRTVLRKEMARAE